MQFVGGTTITLALCRTACDAARLIVGRSGGHPNLGNEVTAQLILAGELTGFPTNQALEAGLGKKLRRMTSIFI